MVRSRRMATRTKSSINNTAMPWFGFRNRNIVTRTKPSSNSTIISNPTIIMPECFRVLPEAQLVELVEFV